MTSTLPATAPTAGRLDAFGRGEGRKPATGPTYLTKRHLAYIRFLVHGLDQVFPRWPDIEPHRPLDTNTAADVAGLRRKNARDLFRWPIFVTAYEQECAALRKGEYARNIHTMIEVRDDPGLGKAADRKVRLGAAMAISGEAGNGGTNVTVNTSIGVQTAPGIVIDLRDDDEIEAGVPLEGHTS